MAYDILDLFYQLLILHEVVEKLSGVGNDGIILEWAQADRSSPLVEAAVCLVLGQDGPFQDSANFPYN